MNMSRSKASPAKVGAPVRGAVKGAPTVRDVAALAGVSPMTVSRTMAGGLNVRPEVQDRVRDAVEKLGYRPNQSARNTRLRKPTGLIGIAVTNLDNPYYGRFALGVQKVASAHGRQIVVGSSGEDPALEEQLLREFAGRQLEGLILVPAGNGLNQGAVQQLGNIPLVLATRTVEGLECDAVLVEDVAGAAAGTAALLEDGHRRIGFLGDVDGISTARRRFEGFRQALERAGAGFDPAHLAKARDSETAAEAVGRLLAGPHPPTAFFSANNRTTVGALRAICERRDRAAPGSRLPTPVPALASFDDVELADLLGVPLSVMSHDPCELGAAAADLLFERLAGTADGGPRLVQLPVTVRRF
ncbi:LacI family DNA-binding transcriptional regulator [Arthrobacter sp. Cr_A7]|uniref:LacI family DNA-binding transcriptional regulator n=1 Tax=Arthrobacter sp. Cr_A7 TaxID=3031017 RepID=UPI0023DA32FA|nr:LacI family DNA-binding transcriptional regulator [Arthrobacter sp. Cr_A7]